MQVVARVQGLTMLNGSAVRQRERQDCELRYLRVITGMSKLVCPQTGHRLPSTLSGWYLNTNWSAVQSQQSQDTTG